MKLSAPFEVELSLAGPLGKPEDFRVVWPTVQSVRESNEGWFAGCSIPGLSFNMIH